MQIKPILSALRHHKAGTVLIMLQIALTLAIVCNALFIIQQRVSRLSSPSGIVESQVLRIQNQWVSSSSDSYGALISGDLDTLRHVPGVVDAYATNSLPLSQGGMSTGVNLKPDQRDSSAQSAFYFGDAHALPTLGLKLIAGRNFRPDEISQIKPDDQPVPRLVIITKALADKLFPDTSAVGKQIFIDPHASTTIVGVVARLQTPWTGNSWGNTNTMLLPFLWVDHSINYVLRVQSGQMASVIKAAPKALFASNRMRVIPAKSGVQSFSRIRADAYASDRGMAILMGVICLVLLAITAAGIVGLTSFWVGQRRKQIGVRRALGATRRDILSYFLTENFLIACVGVLVGAVLAMGLNAWMMHQFEMQRLSLPYVVVGVAALLLLGQAAVLAPALRASRVPPVVATRSV
ncbi:MAG: FtsX-like permease family protein [Rhodanobacter sp.]